MASIDQGRFVDVWALLHLSVRPMIKVSTYPTSL